MFEHQDPKYCQTYNDINECDFFKVENIQFLDLA